MAADAAQRAWNQQSVWSQTANRMKAGLERNRLYVLGLTIAAALLSAGAVAADVTSGVGKVLAGAGAVAIGVAGLLRGGTSHQSVQDWTRARSVSEAMKSEVYIYLAGVCHYRDGDPGAELDLRVEAIERDGEGLERFRLGIVPVQRALPTIDGVDSYLDIRVGGQIDDYYEPQALKQQGKLTFYRSVEAVLAVCGIVLAAVGAGLEHDSLVVWVPVLTTIGATVTAHVAAERFEFLLIEYLRTAAELGRLRDRSGSAAALSDDDLVKRAEHVISVQNEGWMAKLTSDDAAPAGG